ncbi:hypothetical protein [Salinimicrobium oceani]|uniref:Lipoprotein n=1 Tax=Salinimicrobium oceani TaxID=2722702 RepID=A0ABX1D181_9FLAO|nr:hypothetical protein [Salinimicrobium oceani]NJW53057.1 hypothetical protein [Salinimicrobium oceani]
MKKSALILGLLFLLQSCSVYHSGARSVEEAVAADAKVKVISAGQLQYKFRKLELQDDHLVGITKHNSSTAKKLKHLPSSPAGKFRAIDLSEMVIEEIKLRNNTLSTIINIAIPIAALYVALLATYVAVAPPSY